MTDQLENIISRCKDHDRFAQKQLYEFTYSKLGTNIALLTSDDFERNWVFNLGMLKIFFSLEKYRTGTNYLAWARVILKMTAIDYNRKNKSHFKVIFNVDVNDIKEQETDLENALNKLDTEELIKTIQKLPPNERLIFTLYEIDGYTHNEIEKEIKINRNTSKWLLAKAKKSLREMVTLSNKSKTVYTW